MLSLVRRVLPPRLRYLLASLKHARAIRREVFGDIHDPLYQRIGDWISPGDWVIDVGAAIGEYTLRMSNIVGRSGRVIAFEPTPVHFGLLMRNTERSRYENITCMQLAAGRVSQLVSMGVPLTDGAPNHYLATIGAGDLKVWCAPLDSFAFPERIAFIKIDAEGHDFEVLQGALTLISKDKPSLLLEDNSQRVQDLLSGLGYQRIEAASANALYVGNPAVLAGTGT